MSTKFKIQQSEEYLGNDWWKWAVWVEGSEEALDQIEYVEWILDPTFRNPIREVADRSQKFRLETGGWGEFTIHARVQTKEGISFRLRHDLSLHYPSKRRATQQTFEREGDSYLGTTRRAAKLSIGNGKIENFSDVRDLIDALPPDRMSPVPPINADSERVSEEHRNISVRGFLYAARRDATNDFTLIVGRKPDAEPEAYLIMVVSGLPAVNNKYFLELNNVRVAFKEFFGAGLPGSSYDFYDPPITAEVEGSLFLNPGHGTKGPRSLESRIRRKNWEVRPITKLVFPSSE